MTQCEAILDYLKSGHKLTPLKALDYFGTLRLAARINDLKNEGHEILSRPKKVDTRIGKTTVAEYSMAVQKGQMELI